MFRRDLPLFRGLQIVLSTFRHNFLQLNLSFPWKSSLSSKNHSFVGIFLQKSKGNSSRKSGTYREKTSKIENTEVSCNRVMLGEKNYFCRVLSVELVSPKNFHLIWVKTLASVIFTKKNGTYHEKVPYLL